MSVITQRGDEGDTDLMYGRRVSKRHPRIVANGALDELNAVLGLARSQARMDGFHDVNVRLHRLQQQLILVMGEIATATEDQQRYADDGFETITDKDHQALTEEANGIQTDLQARFKDWAIPGAEGGLASAHLDHARTLCRRAEREVYTIDDAEGSLKTVKVYLNRLSDFLWLSARAVDRR